MQQRKRSMMVAMFACLLGVRSNFAQADEAPLAADPAVIAAETDRVAVLDRACQTAVAIFAADGQGGGSGVLISAARLMV